MRTRPGGPFKDTLISTGKTRLLSAFEAGTLVRPSHTAPNLVDLSRALAAACGVSGVQETAGSKTILERIGPAEHLVFILADGLGLDCLKRLPAESFLRRHLAAELLSVFPSTTAVALTSFATGEWPSVHGITGWWTHIPELKGTIAPLPYVERSRGKPPLESAIRPEDAFPCPSLLARFDRDTAIVLPRGLVGTVYSRYFNGGRTAMGYRTLAEAIALAAERVLTVKSPSFTHLYWPNIDEHAHRHGSGWEELGDLVRDLDEAAAALAEHVAGKARIVLCSDHGFMDSPRELKFQIGPADPLVGLLDAPPSGDARVFFLHARSGVGERLADYMTQRFGDLFYVVTIDEAADLGLFGPHPLTELARQRMGTHLAIAQPPAVIEYRPAGEPLRMLPHAAHHSGLSPQEMRVPLVIA